MKSFLLRKREPNPRPKAINRKKVQKFEDYLNIPYKSSYMSTNLNQDVLYFYRIQEVNNMHNTLIPYEQS